MKTSGTAGEVWSGEASVHTENNDNENSKDYEHSLMPKWQKLQQVTESVDEV